MKFNPDKHQRRSIRLRGYDYAQRGAYFVTICAHGRRCVLGDIRNKTMVLSESGRLVERCWYNLARHFPGVELDAFVVMPNHLHGIIILGRGEAFVESHFQELTHLATNASPLLQPHGTQPGSLGAIVQNFKSVSTRKINQMNRPPGARLWQRNYYEHIIRNEKTLYHLRI